MESLIQLGQRAKQAQKEAARLTTEQKKEILQAIALKLQEKTAQILQANQIDLKRAKRAGKTNAFLDRLQLSEDRIKQMAQSLVQVAHLPDPIGTILSEQVRPNGLIIRKRSVPFGVIGMIYEARPNVTIDAFGLCFQTSNVILLRGSKEALETNRCLVQIIREQLQQFHKNPDLVALVEDTSHETAMAFMKLREALDVLIPRGGAKLIQTVVKESTVPIIETGTGNCHIYVDETADFTMACSIIINAKTQRYGVCNACESIVVHKQIADSFLPLLLPQLQEKGVEIRADQSARAIFPNLKEADESDWGMEYLDAIVSIKIVSSLEEAIAHINCYHTKHSDAIITEDDAHAARFLKEVDSAAVYVNASTRFTDGFEFGFGAEMGISTQKLHVRGPMGLEALTTTKYEVIGTGQIRI